ncbi:MAG: membrane lipoprotein lipid attachment site-containing protein [Lentimicrobiaceae bacterium]|jgi:hypothetical protein
MKKILFFLTAGFILASCSNSGSKPQSGDQGEPNEIVITNDLENAMGVIPSWHNERTVIAMKEPPAHSGKYACITNDTMEYSYSFSELFKNLNKGLPKMAVVSGWIYTTVASPKQGIVLDIKDNNDLYEWKVYPLDDVLKVPGKWVEFNASFYFSKPLKPEQKVSIFFWNQSKKPIYVDDFKISFIY